MASERRHSELRTAHQRGGGQVKHLGMVGNVKGKGLGYSRPIGYSGPIAVRPPAPEPGRLASRQNDGRIRTWVPGPAIERGSRDLAGPPRPEYVGWRGPDHVSREKNVPDRT